MDSQLFEFWFEKCLLPELTPDSTIVMDNAAFHRKKRLELIALESCHKVVFLPPYSPEYNPIEKLWSWIKCMLRKVLYCFDNFDESLRYCFNCI